MSDAYDSQLAGHDASKVDKTQIDTTFPMVSNTAMVSSVSQALQGDNSTYNLAKRTAYIGTAQVDDVISYKNTANTDSSGNATFYLTSDRTATGTALYTTIYPLTALGMPFGGSNNYQVTGISITGNKVVVGVNQIAPAVIGLVSVTSAASGIPVNFSIDGK